MKKYVLFVIKGIFLCVMNVILVVIWLSVVLFSFFVRFCVFFLGGEVVFIFICLFVFIFMGCFDIFYVYFEDIC